MNISYNSFNCSYACMYIAGIHYENMPMLYAEIFKVVKSEKFQ